MREYLYIHIEISLKKVFCTEARICLINYNL